MLPRLVIAAPSSGSGKTTVATGLMAALVARGRRVAPFKVGPDYIDPGYHALAAGRPGRNLDPVLVGESRVGPLFAHGAAGADLAVIEGVMGLFDGRIAAGVDAAGFGSTAHVARLLDAPVVLVVDGRGQGRSLAALLQGFRGYDPGVRLAAVVLNRVGSARHEEVLREACAEIGLPVLGAVPRGAEVELPSRHLGLIPAAEHGEPARRAVTAMAELITRSVDLEAVCRLAESAGPTPWTAWDPATEVAKVTEPGAFETTAFEATVSEATVSEATVSEPSSGEPGATRPVAASGPAPGDEVAAWGTPVVGDALGAGGFRATAASTGGVGANELGARGSAAGESGSGGLGVNAAGERSEGERRPGVGEPGVGELGMGESGVGELGGGELGVGEWGSGVLGGLAAGEPSASRSGVGGSVVGAAGPSVGRVGGRRGPGTGGRGRPVVAVAGGAAFTFDYAEHSELLRAAGARVVVVDPLRDDALPDGTAALVLPGGFPEEHTALLSANPKLRHFVAVFARSGGILQAECGGLLYLLDELGGEPMCGVLPGRAEMGASLTLGYRDAVAAADSVLHLTGERVTGHEFHRTHVITTGARTPAWHWRGYDGAPVREGFVRHRIHASYLHTHPAGHPETVVRLVAAARGAA
jgi:cobyrinic acid a,c-diamide synthase